MDFTNDELHFLSDLFKAPSQSQQPETHKLTVQSTIPSKLASLFSNANLTLLAEIGSYQLWFPLEFKTDTLGTFTPILSSPEVIDTKGHQRSWRLDNLNIKSEGFKIESISSTGIFLKPNSKNAVLINQKEIQFELPNNEHVTMNIEPVRHSKKGIAAKIIKIIEGKEQLRAYLFNVHKNQYANLYKEIPTS